MIGTLINTGVKAAKDQAAPGDVIEGGRHLGQDGGIMEAHAGDERTDLDPVRDRLQIKEPRLFSRQITYSCRLL